MTMEIIISDHARFEAKRRDVPIDLVMEITQSPQQAVISINGRIICQSRLIDPKLNKEMLFRVVVKDVANQRLVITVYKTSKIEKYWEVTD